MSLLGCNSFFFHLKFLICVIFKIEIFYQSTHFHKYELEVVVCMILVAYFPY